jgi:hypothetical protein
MDPLKPMAGSVGPLTGSPSRRYLPAR